jgi:hypothetical protein
VGEALLMALADTLGDAFTPELRAAWAEAYALIGPRASLDRHSSSLPNASINVTNVRQVASGRCGTVDGPNGTVKGGGVMQAKSR